MPEVYISQAPLAQVSGSPSPIGPNAVNWAMGVADQSRQQVAEDIQSLFGDPKQRAKEKELEDSIYAEGLLKQANDGLTAAQDYFRSQLATDPAMEPRDMSGQYMEATNELWNLAMDKARERGARAAEYVAKHLQPMIRSHTKDFVTEMEGVHADKVAYGVLVTYDDEKKRAIEEPDRTKSQAIVNDMVGPGGFLSKAVAGRYLTEQDAHKMGVVFRQEVQFERSANLVRRDAIKYLDAYYSGDLEKMTKDFSEDDARTFRENTEKFAKIAEEALKFKNARADRVRTEMDNALKDKQDQNASAVIDAIHSGDLKTTSEFLELSKGIKLSNEQKTHLQNYMQAFDRAASEGPTASDRDTFLRLNNKARAIRESDLVTFGEISAAAEAGKLSTKDAEKLINKMHGAQNYFRDDRDSEYRRQVEKGEAVLRGRFEVSGILKKFDELGNQLMTSALENYHRQAHDNRKLDDGDVKKNPFIWAEEEFTKAVEQLMAQGSINPNPAAMRGAMPYEWASREELNKLRRNHPEEMPADLFKLLSRHHDQIEIMEAHTNREQYNRKVQEAIKAEGGVGTQGGRGSARQ